MKKSLLLILTLVWAASSFANTPLPIEIFRAGLQAFQANGPDALLSEWYNNDASTNRSELRSRLAAAAAKLGQVIEVEAYDPKMLGKRVTRLYGVIYFQRRPLWVRADYYQADGVGGFIALAFSEHPEEILPLEVGIR